MKDLRQEQLGNMPKITGLGETREDQGTALSPATINTREWPLRRVLSSDQSYVRKPILSHQLQSLLSNL